MRIVAIGLGGAGCRIVDSLYSADRKSSRVACVQPLAVDIDEKTIAGLKDLPDNNKICFQAIDQGLPNSADVSESSATIDIAEVIARIHNFESGENDAILICLGLGGSMADVAPHIIAGLRSSSQELIFGLVTLPCLAEGEKRSAQAADQIDILSSLLDGMILFDNETWYKKTKALKISHAKKEKSFVQRLGLSKPEPELSPEMATYALLNEGIVRRISLILKAGEFNSEGEIDLAEVVLDSGEVLNTMKGMGFITIGYAVERLPSNPLAFLSQFRPQGVFDEENKKKASRIVDLAKQAIYHEVSTPCDMTSAHKALVLIAGPSHELSMKGFMTVRKWIDRSIAGLETRSGDYPVMNTKNVAIIIMLSGLENIPRISELREIRSQYRSWAERRRAGGEIPSNDQSAEFPVGAIRDEMIVLPAKMKKEDDLTLVSRRPVEVMESGSPQSNSPKPIHTHNKSEPGGDVPVAIDTVMDKKTTAGTHHTSQETPRVGPDSKTESPLKPSRHRVVVSGKTGIPSPHPDPAHPMKPSTSVDIPESESQISRKKPDELPKVSIPHMSLPSDKDTSRQRIELELQRQRLKAIAGRGKVSDTPPPPTAAASTASHTPAKKNHEIRAKPAIRSTPDINDSTQSPEPESKTVIIPKRKVVSKPQEIPVEETTVDESRQDRPTGYSFAEPAMDIEKEDDTTIAIRDTPYRAKDHVFEGRGVQKQKTTQSKDASLLHTTLKPKKTGHALPEIRVPEVDFEDTDEQEKSGKKADKKGKKPEDISWV